MKSLRRGAVLLLLLLAACSGEPGQHSAGDDGLSVVTSFYPLQYVAERVGGSEIRVESLTPSGVEPHDLELSSSQARDLAAADLIVYVGGGFQPAVEDAIADLDDTRLLDALAKKELLQAADDPHADEATGAPDPHVWLDPSHLMTIADQLAVQLGDLDPGNADTFEDNAQALGDELAELDRDLRAGLRSCDSREFVTSHAAFGYLAARYDLEQLSVSGVDPEAEPSPQRLAEVARFVEEHDVRVIFFEELAPPDLAETLARETGARTDVLSPLETPPEQGDYVDEMRRNLQRLRGALGCE